MWVTASTQTETTVSPIRVLMLITDLEVGGVPLHVLRLAKLLPGDMFDVRIVSLAGVGPVGEMLRNAGITVEACGARSAVDVWALRRLAKYIRAFRPHVLHSFLFHANVAARLVGPLAGVPVRRIICEIQTVERERPRHLVVDGLTCRLCGREVGNSPSVIDHLHRRAHIPRPQLRLMPGAVDVDRFAEASPADRAALGVPADEPVLLWTGRLDPVKGFEELIAAFAMLIRTHPASLLLAGEGARRPAVERLIRRKRVGGRVRLLGVRDDVPALLATADLFVFPSRTEGLPNALLEAMAAGVPIVTTNVPGCRDLVRDRREGLLVPPRSPDDLCRAITTLLDDSDLAQRLARQARRRVADAYAPEAMKTRWIEFYSAVARTRLGG